MLSIRPFVFWVFVVLFFITAFSVVFYAFGYRFNLDRGIFIYTGSISIKSNPETVDIRVDNELIPKQKLGILNNSILIPGLAPGEHFIEVSADGYATWSKKAIVQSGLSTEFWNVLLSQTNNAPQAIPDTAFAEKIFPAPDTNLLAVAKQNNDEFTVATLNTATGASTQVFSLPKASLPADGENIEWSPDNRKLIIPLEQDATRGYFIVNVSDQQTLALQPFIKNDRSLYNPRWDSTTRNLLFYLSGTTLYRANTEVSAELPLFIKDKVKAYDISGSTIYYLNNDNGIIYRIPANRPDAEPTQITTAPIDIDPHDTYALVVYDEKRLAVRARETGKLWVYNEIPSGDTILKPLAESGAKGVQFSNDGKKLLFFTDNEMSVYFINAWDAQPVREADTTLQVARFSSVIKNVQWTKDYEHILFTLGGSVKIVELDSRDRRNIAEIAAFTSPVAQALSRFEENRVYFVNPPNTLSYIPFPVPQTNIFGF